MKSYKNLWDQFISKENFYIAFCNSKVGKSNQKQVQKFCENWEENLENVRQLVISGNFHTSKYITKTIHEPKERVIFMLPYAPDRIVQHAVMNILKPILSNLFIQNTFACIPDRGQSKASNKCSEYVSKFNYCLKCDIKKFFPSINQQILSNKLHRIIRDDRFMVVVDDIIFSADGNTNCPIGNYTSQWFGNYYLSFLDNFVLHTLKCGAYERYCDDFMLFSDDKNYLNYCKTEIEKFLWNELNLTFSKCDLFPIKQGVDFVGYRHFPGYKLVRKSTSKRIKKRINGIEKAIDKGEKINDTIRGQIASANGVLKHANTYNFKKSLEFDELMNKAGINSKNRKKNRNNKKSDNT